jgi:phosphate transport system permease protein
MGETAPLLFTTAGAFGLTFNLDAQMNALPLQIFNDITSPRQAVIDRAWGAALTLVVLVLIFNLLARAFSRKSRMT